MAFLIIALTGCKSLFGWPNWSFWSTAADTGFEFVADNDAVFDLFGDGEGTDVQPDGDWEAANDPGPPVSTTQDPVASQGCSIKWKE